MITELELAEGLKALGPDPDAVAASFAEAGARGRRRNAYECPVAVWAKAFAGAVSSSASPMYVYAHYLDGTVRAATPRAVAVFMNLFDREGRYPELEDGDAPPAVDGL